MQLQSHFTRYRGRLLWNILDAGHVQEVQVENVAAEKTVQQVQGQNTSAAGPVQTVQVQVVDTSSELIV